MEIVDRLQRIRAMLLEVRQELKGRMRMSSKFSSIIRPCRLRNTRQGIPAVRDFARNGRSGRRLEPGRGRDGGESGKCCSCRRLRGFGMVGYARTVCTFPVAGVVA
ncbi:MAG: hypothetical protein ACLR8Y_12840 [Alistipes indistinctus]